ncbi:LysR family transcriptional regulator [Afifella sp. IM 167]|uniref:LysR family transcriptional regulator n=1 Tax=Afifella sp. IM 167 TaxID=2033586 RepID=UPI001CCA96CD|nr:LysR family transcriptional regulator [Afifella sp. IM 167]
MLEAFNAVMAEGGFLRASKRLNLSPSAVSYTIKSLEGVLGVELFERRPDGIVPTRFAADLVGDTRLIIENLQQLAEKASNLSGRERTLRILTSQAFASLWLLPRMGALIDAFPGWHFEVISWIGGYDSQTDRGLSGIDVEIRWTDLGPPPRAVETYELARDFALPVCSPGYLDFLGGELTAESAARATVFHALNWPGCWPRWVAHAFGGEIGFNAEIYLQTTSLSVQAAQGGVGIAMAHGPLIQRELQDGSLVLANTQALPLGEAYIAVRYRAAAAAIFGDLVVWLRRNVAAFSEMD